MHRPTLRKLVTFLTIAALLAAIVPATAAANRASRHGVDRAGHGVAHRHGKPRRRDMRRTREERRQARRELRRLVRNVSSVTGTGTTAHAGEGSRQHETAQRSLGLAGSETCQGEDLMPEPGDLEAVRSATLCLVNRERSERGVRALSFNGKLERAAQGHSENMVLDDYFSHYGPNAETPSQRMRAAGYIYSEDVGYEIGENIAWGTLYLATPKAIVQAWMESPGHRENILDSRYRETAIGVVAEVPAADAEGQAGAIYTQDFGVLITG